VLVEDDWKIPPQVRLNVGLRYELDTDVKNVSGYGEVNPLVQPFLVGDRSADKNNFGPRVGFNWTTKDGRTSVHGGYGIYYDRVTLEIMSLERGLDGRALAVEVRAGNVFFFDPRKAGGPRSAPASTIPSPASTCPGPAPPGSTLSTTRTQNPAVH